MSRNMKIVLGIILAYACLATVIISGFVAINNNPIDVAAMTYIWSNAEEIEPTYGEITHIGRYIKGKEKNDNQVSVLYGVEVESGELKVRVYLLKENGEWIVQSMEIEEFDDNVQ